MPGTYPETVLEHNQDDKFPGQMQIAQEPEKTKQQKENDRKARQLKEKKARQRAEKQAAADEEALRTSRTADGWFTIFEARVAYVDRMSADSSLLKAQKREELSDWMAWMEKLASDYPNAAVAHLSLIHI